MDYFFPRGGKGKDVNIDLGRLSAVTGASMATMEESRAARLRRGGSKAVVVTIYCCSALHSGISGRRDGLESREKRIVLQIFLLLINIPAPHQAHFHNHPPITSATPITGSALPHVTKAMARPLVTVIGSLNIDLITRTTRVPRAGETLITSSYDTGCGGKGANQAVACARLSRRQGAEHREVDVRMVGAVGRDAFGKELVDSLMHNGIDTRAVEEKEEYKTGVAVIIVEEATGDNRILMSPNANYSLRPEAFAAIEIPIPKLIVLQLEIPLDTTLQILKAAKKQHVDVLLNPAPAQVLPPQVYDAVTHLVVNESEAAFITESSQASESISKEAIKRLLAFGVHHVIVTLGSKGVLYFDTHGGLVHELKAEKVEVKDTTAAGDTFVGAYAVAIAKQQDGTRSFERTVAAICWANKAAAKTVQREGAQSAIPWLGEVDAYGGATAGLTHQIDDWLQGK